MSSVTGVGDGADDAVGGGAATGMGATGSLPVKSRIEVRIRV